MVVFEIVFRAIRKQRNLSSNEVIRMGPPDLPNLVTNTRARLERLQQLEAAFLESLKNAENARNEPPAAQKVRKAANRREYFEQYHANGCTRRGGRTYLAPLLTIRDPPQSAVAAAAAAAADASTSRKREQSDRDKAQKFKKRRV